MGDGSPTESQLGGNLRDRELLVRMQRFYPLILFVADHIREPGLWLQ